MTSATASVIIASAQSVGKVYAIGAVGFFAVTCELFCFSLTFLLRVPAVVDTSRYFELMAVAAHLLTLRSCRITSPQEGSAATCQVSWDTRSIRFQCPRSPSNLRDDSPNSDHNDNWFILVRHCGSHHCHCNFLPSRHHFRSICHQD